jgi:hypothetical protein
VRRGGSGIAVGSGSCVGHDFRLLRSGICRFSALGGLKKDIRFITGEFGAERRCQLPTPASGAEASTAVFMPRGAAQAELTEGAERSLEFAGKRMSNRWSSRRLHRIAFQGRRCGQDTGPHGWEA